MSAHDLSESHQPEHRLSLKIAGRVFCIEADAACSPALERFRRAWSSAPQGHHLLADSALPFLARLRCDGPAEEVSFEVDGWEKRGEYSLSLAHWTLEMGLLEYLRLHRDARSCMMHAGCVARGGRGFLFLGPSGAGKSSFCLSAVRQGYHYLSDDVVLTDGALVWGVPRGIQFDPPQDHEPYPAWLAEADLDTSLYPEAQPGDGYGRPLFVPGLQRCRETIPAQILTPVHLRRGPRNEISYCSGPHMLALLIEAGILPTTNVDLGRIASGGGYELTWQDPRSALRLLEATLSPLDAAGCVVEAATSSLEGRPFDWDADP